MQKIAQLKGVLLFILAIVLISAGLFISRSFNDIKPFQRSEYIMGTIFDITVMGNDGRSVEEAVAKAFNEIRRIDDLMSRYKEGSGVSLINNNAGMAPVKVGQELIEVLLEAKRISELSDGAFDVTIGPLTDLWGFDMDRNIVPPKEKIEELKRFVNYKKLRIDEAASMVFLEDKGMMIDLGGIAKGYSVSKAMKVFEGAGIKDVIINAGGNLNLRGSRSGRPWRIGIQDPRNDSKLIGRLSITDITVATSGDYQRYFIKDGIRYHHILNPKTGFPAKGLISATVVGKSKTSMDGFSSAVLILGADKGIALMKKAEAEGVMITEDGKMIVTDGLREKFLAKP